MRRLETGAPLDGAIVMSPVGRMIHPGNAAQWVTYADRFPYRELVNRLD